MGTEKWSYWENGENFRYFPFGAKPYVNDRAECGNKPGNFRSDWCWVLGSRLRAQENGAAATEVNFQSFHLVRNFTGIFGRYVRKKPEVSRR